MTDEPQVAVIPASADSLIQITNDIRQRLTFQCLLWNSEVGLHPQLY